MATWWLYGVVLFPIALVHSLVMSTRLEENDQLEPQPGEYLCPFCAEFVRNEATICRFCGRDLPYTERITASSSTEFLITQLQSADNRVRNEAIVALGNRGAAAREAQPALRALIKDPVLDIRRRAKWALETMGRR